MERGEVITIKDNEGRQTNLWEVTTKGWKGGDWRKWSLIKGDILKGASTYISAFRSATSSSDGDVDSRPLFDLSFWCDSELMGESLDRLMEAVSPVPLKTHIMTRIPNDTTIRLLKSVIFLLFFDLMYQLIKWSTDNAFSDTQSTGRE